MHLCNVFTGIAGQLDGIVSNEWRLLRWSLPGTHGTTMLSCRFRGILIGGIPSRDHHTQLTRKGGGSRTTRRGAPRRTRTWSEKREPRWTGAGKTRDGGLSFAMLGVSELQGPGGAFPSGTVSSLGMQARRSGVALIRPDTVRRQGPRCQVRLSLAEQTPGKTVTITVIPSALQ